MRIAEEKRVQKHDENVGITSFSRYAAEEDKLRIVRSSGGPENFLEILALLVQNFLIENP